MLFPPSPGLSRGAAAQTMIHAQHAAHGIDLTAFPLHPKQDGRVLCLLKRRSSMIDDYTPADWIGWTILAVFVLGVVGAIVSSIHFIVKFW